MCFFPRERSAAKCVTCAFVEIGSKVRAYALNRPCLGYNDLMEPHRLPPQAHGRRLDGETPYLSYGKLGKHVRLEVPHASPNPGARNYAMFQSVN